MPDTSDTTSGAEAPGESRGTYSHHKRNVFSPNAISTRETLTGDVGYDERRVRPRRVQRNVFTPQDTRMHTNRHIYTRNKYPRCWTRRAASSPQESRGASRSGSPFSCLLVLRGRRARMSGVQGSGFGVQGSGFRVQGSGFRVQGSGFRVQGSGFRVQGSGLSIQG